MAPAERKLSIFFPSLSPVLEPLSVGNSKNTPPKSDIHGPSTLDGGSTPNTNHSHPATPRKDTLDTPKMAKNKGAKAKNMITCISGLKGKFPIHTAVAYWYRGHYIYGTTGNPIEPVPFATKEIHIIGTTANTAPIYDPNDVDLKWEFELLALHKSMLNEWDNITRDKAAELAGKATAEQNVNPENAQLETKGVAQTGAHDQQETVMTMPSESPSTDSVSATAFPVFDNFYNDQAMYLASSAPVSQQGTPTRSNTPLEFDPYPGMSLHWSSASGSSGSGLRSVPSMARIDQLMVEHGIKRSIATLQQTAPWLLNESAVATVTNLARQNAVGSGARPAALSRIPSMYADADNVYMSNSPGRVVSGGSSVPAGSTPKPMSVPHSRMPSVAAGLNEFSGSVSGTASRPVSRIQSYASLRDASTNENAFNEPSVSIPRIASVPSQLNEAFDSKMYRTLPGLGPRPIIHTDSSGNILRPSIVTTSSAAPAGPSFQKASNPPSRPGSSLSGTPMDLPTIKRPSPPSLSLLAQSSAPGTRAPTPVPQSRPVSRVPSSTHLAADDVFSDSSSALPRSKSTLSLLGDGYNGHHSRFFPTTPLHSPIGTGRPRKDSMAKASRALNEAYNRSRSNTTIYDPRGHNPGGDESAVTSSAEESGSEGEKESGSKGLLKCPLHGEECDGVTTTTLHQTENARRYRGIVGPVPVLRSEGREMVDWELLLQKTKREMGL